MPVLAKDCSAIKHIVLCGDTAFRALYRFVNREFRSDAINLTGFGEIEPAHYIGRFRQVFVRTRFEEH
ncbi:hypothetical protein CSW00_20045 [Pseudomonas asiatica]|nr:hypothetical protein CSW00_20045 [Pseudomonas sp. MR 02]